MSGIAAPNYYYPTVKTDQQIREDAKKRADSLYEAYFKNLETMGAHQKSLYQQQIADLEPIYQKRLKELRETYEQKGDQLSDYALSRGMGRSSYALDMQNRNAGELAKAEVTVGEEKTRQVNLYNREILSLTMELESKKNELSAQKQREMLDTIRGLELERNDTLFEAQKYNDRLWSEYQDRILKERQYQLQEKRYELDVKKYQASLQKQSAARRTSSGGGSKKSSGLDTASILRTWNSLSFTGKVQYLDQNGKTIRGKNASFYNQLKKEYDAIQTSQNLINRAIRDTFPMLF